MPASLNDTLAALQNGGGSSLPKSSHRRVPSHRARQ